MGKKIFKEIFIFILVILVVGFTISMIFYDFFHNTQELPKLKEYIADSNVRATLQEIEAESEEREDGESLLKSYEIVKADLKNYQTGGSYDKGKQHPFKEYETRAHKEYATGTSSDENTVGNTTSTTKNNTTTSSSTTANTTKTNSTTTTTSSSSSTQGTLFEKENSK